ncbi:Oxoglutarate/iron-dependent dioxygenase [Cinnamomum micranthum f. kanehirae]|uniref:Oxoglutarate/iron-dependent dioxygenase n=1 Tax=Cinnamomum micranthum f. kanehirae TaxID=337451 RepID=A0A3S4PDG2_9MAGN|nr:Oxoglutarate/iron-dependent dioxygenase [Cinnamomum micranthum f. kanehirae]
MEEIDDSEILEPFQLHFSDLLLLSPSSPSLLLLSSSSENGRLESISRAVMETLGPSGPGLLAITGVPKASDLRRTLLPLARKLALLSNEDRRRILKDNSLGSDVPLKNPDRSVSSFALQLKYVQDAVLEETLSGSSHNDDCIHIANKEHSDMDSLHDSQDSEFTKLSETFKELGICMMELGVRLARICDKAIGSHELEQSILDSCTAKGRLIHYHSVGENLYLKELGRMKKSAKGPVRHCFSPHVAPEQGKKIPVGPGITGGELMSLEAVDPETCANRISSCRPSLSNLWQQWHYDYGIFTVLTAPMFMSPCESQTIVSADGFHKSSTQECYAPDGHTHLQIFDPKKNKILLVKSTPESFIVQVGESADILSKGMLRSTLHSVSRPVENVNLSRETFVVFLQPGWDKVFSLSGCPTIDVVRGQESSTLSSDVPGNHNEQILLDSDATCIHLSDNKSPKLSQEIFRVIPPLYSRLKDGMTFAEFSRETTKQYYGGNGMQSKR